ncbi:splicing factor U2AF 35 kDa subunit-like [Panonychus citri]|uniref:splicing factor U2AF 35 kDa subunit-like n=1 Tax=Panonychus citri TaxID=50023 RepID=UPI0023073B29|nr:splicing factor U2AF 35 kDa subunit-like [Panonychus citri]
MAEYLASIFGTEKDKVNCSFFFKIGACRHGNRCSRIHNKPTFSQTILLQNLYQNPRNAAHSLEGNSTGKPTMTEEEDQKHFDDFFEDVFVELEDKYGEIEEMNICDNLGDHLVGNVYVKFRREEDADKAVRDLNNRWFAGRPIYAELSPVTDFREACCRQYEMGECTRSGFCNFMHLKPISRDLRRQLFGRRRGTARSYRSRSRSGSRERGRGGRDRGRSRSRDSGSRKRERKSSHSRERIRSRSRDRNKSKERERRSRSRNRSKSRERRERSRDRDRKHR